MCEAKVASCFKDLQRSSKHTLIVFDPLQSTTSISPDCTFSSMFHPCYIIFNIFYHILSMFFGVPMRSDMRSRRTFPVIDDDQVVQHLAMCRFRNLGREQLTEDSRDRSGSAGSE